MRLFLSSYRAGNYPDKLIELFGKNSKIAVISNAKDYQNLQERSESMSELLAFFSSLGLKPNEIDLRPYFNDPANLENQFHKYQAVWLAGGNTFLLRRALKQTELDVLLGNWVRKNKIVYGGESAGAIIVGPTLRGADDKTTNEDNPDFIPSGYDKKIIWEGLNLIDYVPVPHYKSPDYGDIMDDYVEYLSKRKIPHKPFTEQQAIIINDDKEEFLK